MTVVVFALAAMGYFPLIPCLWLLHIHHMWVMSFWYTSAEIQADKR